MRSFFEFDDLIMCGIVDFCNAVDKKRLVLTSRDVYLGVSRAAMGVFILQFRVYPYGHSVHLPKSLYEIFRLTDGARSSPSSKHFCEAFLYACASGYLRYVQHIIRFSTIPELKRLVDYKSSDGSTALQLSLDNDHGELVHIVCTLAREMDNTERVYKHALLFASEMSHVDTIWSLLNSRLFRGCAHVGTGISVCIKNRSTGRRAQLHALQLLTAAQCDRLFSLKLQSLQNPLDKRCCDAELSKELLLLIQNIALIVTTYTGDRMLALLKVALKDVLASPDLVFDVAKCVTSSQGGDPSIASILPTAAGKGNVEAVSLLLDSGISRIDDALADTRKTGLYVACEKGDLDLVKFFLSREASIALTTSSSRNCLHIAVERDYTEIVETLCEHACTVEDLVKKNSTGFSPYWMANNHGNMRMVLAMLATYKRIILQRTNSARNRPDGFLTMETMKHAALLKGGGKRRC